MQIEFKPGFRFSVLDGMILAAALLLAILVFPYSPNYSVLVGFVVLHFFLFCNVVRMSRIPELIWATVFLALFSCQLKLSVPSFNTALALSSFVTAILVAIEIRRPSYHGIFWKTLNPKLPEWFAKNQKRGA